MQNVSVFNLLDIIVKMTNSKTNADTLSAELEDILAELKYKKRNLKHIESTISDDRYFDASSEIVDRNIEISTSKKIKNLEYEISELYAKLSDLDKEAKNEAESIKNIEDKIANFTSYLEVVEKRKNSSKDEQTINLYTEIDEQENKILDELKADLEIKQQENILINSDIDTVQAKIESYEQTLETEKTKLIEIQENLKNRTAYVNNALKQQDEEEISRLNNSIAKLEQRADEITNNPTYIVNNIKELIANNDKSAIEKELDHLIEEVEKIPFMSINSDEKLSEELEKAKEEQEKYVEYIENKRYDGIDTPLIEDRIEFLKNEIITKSEEIENYKNIVNNIDTNSISEIENKIREAEELRKNLEKEIVEFDQTEEDEGRKRASIQASLNRKKAELKTINGIINSYIADQRRYIELANEYENEKIEKLQSLINSYENEINDLKKLLILKNKSKDVVEMEKDQDKLQEINKNIEMIKYRGEFKTTPRKIVSDIRKKLEINYDYNAEDESTDEEYQEMLETPAFNEEQGLNELQSMLLNNPIFKNDSFEENQETGKKLKVINITPYEHQVEALDLLDDLQDNEELLTDKEENDLWA